MSEADLGSLLILNVENAGCLILVDLCSWEKPCCIVSMEMLGCL